MSVDALEIPSDHISFMELGSSRTHRLVKCVQQIQSIVLKKLLQQGHSRNLINFWNFRTALLLSSCLIDFILVTTFALK